MGSWNRLKRRGRASPYKKFASTNLATHNSKISQNEGGDLSQHNDCGDVYDGEEDDDDDDRGGDEEDGDLLTRVRCVGSA